MQTEIVFIFLRPWAFYTYQVLCQYSILLEGENPLENDVCTVRIEVYDPLNDYRTVLIYTGLSAPRGIVVDPLNG